MISNVQRSAEPSAHTSGALRLGRLAGSTRVNMTLSMVVHMSAKTKWTDARLWSVSEELTGVTYPV